MEKSCRQYIHFSFDDVCHCLKDIIDHANEYHSIFENELFAWMKEMHNRYGAVFSLYTFNYFTGEPTYDISDLPNCYAKELAEVSYWLKFGFHARDDKKAYKKDESDEIKADYDKFLNAIMYATEDNHNCLDRVVRLGFFGGTKANVLALRDCKQGIQGLLTADNDEKRLSYYFDEMETAVINKIGEYRDMHLLFLRSQLRMELVDSINTLTTKIQDYTEPKVIELFAHESSWYQQSRVDGYNTRQLAETFMKWADMNGYGFGFAQDIYEL